MLVSDDYVVKLIRIAWSLHSQKLTNNVISLQIIDAVSLKFQLFFMIRSAQAPLILSCFSCMSTWNGKRVKIIFRYLSNLLLLLPRQNKFIPCEKSSTSYKRICAHSRRRGKRYHNNKSFNIQMVNRIW